MSASDTQPGPAFDPVQRASLADSVLVALRRAIVNGEIAPGTHLVETDLADQFEVSRATIRQALAQCKVEGLIDVRPHRGAVVTRMSNEAARDVCVVRGLLEGWVARMSCLALREEDLESMRAISRQMGDAVREGDVYRVANLDIDFHERILTSDGNEYLRERWLSLNALHGALLATRLAYYHYDPTGIVERHFTLIDALSGRDPDSAEKAVRAHYIAPFIPEGSTHPSLDGLATALILPFEVNHD